MVQFTSVPIWVQFKKIPYYLLCKALARDLGRKIGTYICIDNNARGDLCDKLIRARVHLPINRALLRWVTLMDGVTNEEVIAHVHYERLPTFCFLCGFIGHRDTECIMAGTTRRKSYGADLGVAPILPEDSRVWFMPEHIGQPRQKPGLLWRQSTPSINQRGRELAIIAHVAKEVGKLSVNDKPASNNNDLSLGKIIIGSRTNSDSSPTPSAEADKPLAAGDAGGKDLQTSPTSSSTEPVPPAIGRGVGEESATTYKDPRPKSIEGPTWKRRTRETTNETRTTQGLYLGATRAREEEEDYSEIMPDLKKKVVMMVPSLQECLGEEGLSNKLRALERTLDVNVTYVNKQGRPSDKALGSESLVDNRDSSVLDVGVDRELMPSEEQQGDVTKDKGHTSEEQSKKTEPDTDGMDPGTKEGAWVKK
jgi:hypothetical protein